MARKGEVARFAVVIIVVVISVSSPHLTEFYLLGGANLFTKYLRRGKRQLFAISSDTYTHVYTHTYRPHTHTHTHTHTHKRLFIHIYKHT